MRLDGFNYLNTLPERGVRPAPANSEPSRAGNTAPAAPVEPVVALAPRSVAALSPNAEYIPARREPQEPVYGRAGIALASYQSTAELPDPDAQGVFGLDLFV
jgi:hypothetical protein